MKFLNLISLGCTIAGVSSLSMIPAVKYSGKKVKVQKKISKHECWKWILDFKNGELIVCPSEDYNKITFYLWWFRDYDMKKNNGWGQDFIPVQKLEIQGNVISFVFEGQPSKDSNKKLHLDKWSQWRAKGMTALNDQVLSNVCKLESSHLSCTSLGFRQKLDQSISTFYF